MKFKIYDAEVELDFLDADEMERVEAALSRVTERSKDFVSVPNGLTQSQLIRSQCKIVFDFFDEVFGEGTHKRIFGSKCNLIQALNAFDAFNTAKESSVKEVRAISDKYNANRAQRRANQVIQKKQQNHQPIPYSGNGKKRHS